MINRDWERAAVKDTVYAIEREEEVKEEFYSFRRPAKITYKKKKDEVRHITIALPKLNEESI